MSRTLDFIVPGDPAQRTGGYLYDAHIAAELRRLGWTVTVHGLPGRFPRADATARTALARTLDAIPSGRTVLVDGLALGGLPEVALRQRDRLALIALVHHPLGDERGLSAAQRACLYASERAALGAAQRILTTSAFTARRLAGFGVSHARIAVVEPGVAPLPLAPADGEPPRLLCVGSLAPRKGQDLLVRALAGLRELPWQCELIGSTARNPDFAAEVGRLIEAAGLQERVRLLGECSDEALHAAYAEADLFVLPSYYEGYGMVVTEALAAGLPVLTTTGGALADTLPAAAGIAVPPGEADTLGEALSSLLRERSLRLALRDGAREARGRLRDWRLAGAEFAAALTTSSSAPTAPHPDACFNADWLALRATADSAARAPRLAALAAEWLRRRQVADPGRALRITDLGSGSGANPRHLAPRLPGPQQWTLVDHDPALLAHARVACEALRDAQCGTAALRTRCADLGQLDRHTLAEADLVTASALLDLVEAAWLDRLAQACAQTDCALLITLSVDGGWSFSPASSAEPADAAALEAEDDFVREAFNAHQRRDKGLGPALGPDAAPALAAALRQRGFTVTLAPSPWRLDLAEPASAALAQALIDGWRDAASAQRPEAGTRIDAWHARRSADCRSGPGRLEVGHLDLFALPPAPGESVPPLA